MSFLNAILLWGTLAFSVPVIIHLFHKSRFEVVRWGAMHLLETVIRTNQRKLKIEQWLLLLLRAAIPVILALLMARPVWRGAQALLGEAPTSTVVLLDNSYSMQAGKAGVSTFGLARDEAAKLLNGLRRGSEAQVILMGEGGAPLLDQPTSDLQRAAMLVGQLNANHGAATVPAALQFSGGMFERMHAAIRQVVVLTDFQRTSFEATERKELSDMIARLKALPVAPSITFFDVGQDVKDNVAVESLDFSKLMIGVGQKMQIRGNIRNFGETPYPDLRVFLKVDGKEKSVSQISLGARQSAQVLFSHAFETAGSHVVEVYAEADALKADNSLLASVTVRDKLPVLLVDGDPSNEPLKGETAFAEIALRPFGSARTQITDLITTQTIKPESLNAKALSTSATVLLANVKKLADNQVRELEDFVRNGGGLLIFPGDKIDTAWYERVLYKDGKGLLPLAFGTMKGNPESPTGSTSVVVERFQNPALEIFNDPRNGTMGDAAIKVWFSMKDAMPSAAGGPAILARQESGDPFLVEKGVGEGKVIVASTAVDADWSNLPLRASYLPMLQRLSVYLASTVYPPRNLEVGRSIAAFLPPAHAGKKAIVTAPDGTKAEVAVVKKGTRGVVEWGQTQQPGLYTVLPPDAQPPLHYVVNASRKESDLERLTPEEITEFGKANGVSIVRSEAEYKQTEHERRYGREVWKTLLWALLALALGELFLQQKFAGVRRGV